MPITIEEYQHAKNVIRQYESEQYEKYIQSTKNEDGTWKNHAEWKKLPGNQRRSSLEMMIEQLHYECKLENVSVSSFVERASAEICGNMDLDEDQDLRMPLRG